MKKFLLSLFAALLLAAPALALEASVPGFDVYIGDDRLDFRSSDYPLLLYNDITYFPMTYDYIHWLGLTNSWIDGEFSIAYYDCALGYFPTGPQPGPAAPEVCVGVSAAYDIYVNGKRIDNSAEEYPLFNYNGITYFPMTWRFATEEFGLALSWDGDLHINKSPGRYGFDFYNTEGSRAYFEYRTEENGVISTRSACFDASDGEFYPGSTSRPEEAWSAAEGLSLNSGLLLYSGVPAADLSSFTGQYPSAEFDISARKLNAGSATIVEANIVPLSSDGGYVTQGYYTPRCSVVFAVRGGRATVLAINNGAPDGSFYVDKALDTGGKLYVSLCVGSGSCCYSLICLEPGGEVVRFADADHASIELLGSIGGKPVVRSTYQAADNLGMVSLANDGFFTIENDRTSRRLYRFVDGRAFVLNDTLYLAIERTGRLLDTRTGQEYNYRAALGVKCQ